MSRHTLGEKSKTNIEVITGVIVAKILVADIQELIQKLSQLIWLYNGLFLKVLDRYWNIKEMKYRYL